MTESGGVDRYDRRTSEDRATDVQEDEGIAAPVMAGAADLREEAVDAVERGDVHDDPAERSERTLD